MLVLAWVAFPLALAALAVGCGLLLNEAAGRAIPAVLVPGVGLAAIILVGQFLTTAEATAGLATPAVVGLAAAGYAARKPWVDRPGLRLDVVLVAALAFAVFAAPFVASGQPTFGGYIKLDDTASWLGMTDRVMQHGPTFGELPPSSYEAMLDFYLGSDYPVGVFLPVGMGHALIGQDGAWLYQPYIAVVASLLALTLYELTRRWIASGRLRALTAVIAAQPALLYGFYLWGGAKEVAAAWALALLAALVPMAISGSIALIAPATVVAAATLAMLSVGGGLWILPPLLLGLVVAIQRGGAVVATRRAGVVAVLILVLSVPSLLALDFLSAPAASTVTNQTRLANLIQPLSGLQAFGIWPVEDFRLRPNEMVLTYALVAILGGAAIAGSIHLWQRRQSDIALPIYLASAVASCVLVTGLGSPWVDAKALAIASPAFVVAGMVGVSVLLSRGHRAEAWVVGTLVVGGVVWSNALGYQGVNLAPSERMAELEAIGEAFAGDGPALMTEYEPYGVRHFLRNLDPEGASELRRRALPLREGRSLNKAEYADLDRFQIEDVLIYRTLVLRRSPSASRPPTPYRLAHVGEYYEVWQRGTSGPDVLEHLPLGDAVDPAGVANCTDLLELARRHPGARLAAVARQEVTVVDPSRVTRPANWSVASNPRTVAPDGDGTIEVEVDLPSGGHYSVWVGGAFRGRVEVSIGAGAAMSRRHELSHGGQYVHFGDASLQAGSHLLTLGYSRPRLRPGSRGRPYPLGPVVLARSTADRPVMRLDPPDVRSLCGRRLDWVEAIRP